MATIVERLDEASKYIEEGIYRSVIMDAATEIEKLNKYILDLESSVRYLTLQSTKGM